MFESKKTGSGPCYRDIRYLRDLLLPGFQAPSERARLYFLLAWFHAIVQERLRYSPLGWSKRYEFSESDLRVACDTLDTWLESVSQVSRLPL